jgi:hypothetical protein
MTREPYSFKRLVLGLQARAPDRDMRLAVDLAGLLGLDLVGLFLEDTSVRNLAALPFAREFRPLGGGWQPIDLARLSLEFEQAARTAERLFMAAAKQVAAGCQFEVMRGPTADTIATVSRGGDIVMIVEPGSPAERATQQYAWLLEAAFCSAAAVMLVPARIARTRGPVAVIARSPDDPSIAVAAAIAQSSGERATGGKSSGEKATTEKMTNEKATSTVLIVLAGHERPDHDAHLNKLAAETGIATRQIAVRVLRKCDSEACARALGDIDERLIVVTRGVITNVAASELASSRQVPVLVVEPQDEAADAQ